MRVLTIAMARDEEILVPYFVRHYLQVGDVTIFDDNSVDDTASAARAEGAIVLPVVGQEGDHPEDRLLRAKNHAWKPVRHLYDWIIAVDSDEFLHHADLHAALWHCRHQGITVLVPAGYQMVADGPPLGGRPITEQIRRGVPEPLYSKPCCFNPQKVAEINYCVGAHNATPEGAVTRAEHGLKLLHYRYLGLDWVTARHASRRRWQAPHVTPQGWCNYDETPEQLREIMVDLRARATEVV
jgi:hypothetical protein